MLRLVIALGIAAAAFATSARADDEAAFVDRRAALVREIEALGLSSPGVFKRTNFDPRVIAAIATTPRHAFVPEDLLDLAYDNRPLPIGYGQTISQPYVVAWMTDALALEPGDRVLEVGTGSGYQAAVLASLGHRVFTIEVIEPLGRAAADRLARHGYASVEVRIGDGYYGWPDEAPFEAIIVTAAASHVPPPLVEQLTPGGRMVIPVGGPFEVQYLVLVDKDLDGAISVRQTLPVAFVPLVGGP